MSRLISPIRFPSGLVIERKPQTDFELWVVTKTMFGLQVPRVQVCPEHTAPFRVFADSFFGRVGVQIVKGSRGLSGKSYMAAGLGLVTAILHGCKVNVLGGSAAQSVNVHEHMSTFWDYPNSPKYMLAGDPTKYDTRLRNGGKIRALLASSRSVRGPHPARLFLDEIDEMELRILDDAMGMPMDQTIKATGEVIQRSTTMVSTHQYAAGTMTELLKRARTDHPEWKVHEVCWREAANPIDGWLDLSLVRGKKQDVSKEMWRIEYELGEPAIEGRAITSENVKTMFDRNRTTSSGVLLGMYEGKPGEEYIFQHPEPGVRYATGVDWARTKDWTVITTYRMDTWEMVAFQRTNKEAWPVMIGKAIRRYKRYPGLIAHDATGLGDVISDLFPSSLRDDDSVIDFKLQGAPRQALFSEYITAVEQDTFAAPYIEWAHDEHLYCVAAGSLVLTDKGELPIEQIEPGMQVATRKGWRKALHRTLMGSKPTVELVVNRRTLKVTADHRIATPSGWVEAGSLSVGSLVFTTDDSSALAPLGGLETSLGVVSHVRHSTHDDLVYDIGVEGVHEFVAEGVVVHNCTHDDLYRAGHQFHPPDSVVSGALAWHCRLYRASTAAPVVEELEKPLGEGWFDTPGMADHHLEEDDYVVSFG